MLTLDRLHMPSVLVDVSPVQALAVRATDTFTSTARAKLAVLRTANYPAEAAKTYRGHDGLRRSLLPGAAALVGVVVTALVDAGTAASLVAGTVACLGLLPFSEGQHRDAKRRDIRDASYDLMTTDLQDFETFLTTEAKNAPAESRESLRASAKTLLDEAALADDPIIRARTCAALSHFNYLVGPPRTGALPKLPDLPLRY